VCACVWRQGWENSEALRHVCSNQDTNSDEKGNSCAGCKTSDLYSVQETLYRSACVSKEL